MDDIAAREYSALRDTIRSRGEARPLAFLAGFGAWALVLAGILAWLPAPVASVVPLLVLAATFEVVRSFHLGVERIGRYIQVFFEENAGGSAATAPAWERTAMAFGPSLPGAGVHPYFLPVFFMATAVNFLAVIFPGPVTVELVTLGIAHGAFLAWLIYCDVGMRKQRATELDRFRTLRGAKGAESFEAPKAPSPPSEP
jgi:hypothetical protein